MKSTKFWLNFVFICVMLASFNKSFAINYQYIKPEDTSKLDQGVTGDGLNLDSFGIYGEDYSKPFEFTYTGSTPSVFTVAFQRIEGKNAQTEVSYRIQVYEDGAWKDLRLVAYKDGENYRVYSPTSSDGGTTATVMLSPGKKYRVTGEGASKYNQSYEFKLSFYRNPAYNDPKVENYQTDLNAAMRTSTSVSSNDKRNLESSMRLAETSESGGTGVLISYSGQTMTQKITGNKKPNIFEKALVSLFLTIGDFFVKILSDIIGEDVTVASLVYNRVAVVNPNFWGPTSDSNILGAKVKDIINGWYMFFRGVALTFYVIALLAIGVHVIYNSTGAGVQKAKELFYEWCKGLLILFCMPILMKYILMLNESLVALLAEDSGTNIKYGSSFNDGSNWSAEAIEFRSPLYVSKYTGSVSYGSAEANLSYIKKVGEYEKNFDIMRIMRAYAGVTYKLGYVFIWYVTIGQLVVFVVLYFKRFFMITFLIGVFPIICTFHAISLWQGGKGRQVSTWLSEFLSNVFIQFIHAIIYTIITGVCLDIIRETVVGGTSSSVANWLIMIVAINFIPEGEKILKKIFSALSSGNTAGGVGESSQGIKKAFQNGKNHVKKIMGG